MSVVGGDGNDKLFGGSGRDVVIGGAGRDQLFGEGQDDILISGSTDLDEDQDALFALLVDWNSTDSYATRVNNLGTGGGSSGIILDDSAVLDDGAADELFGGGGLVSVPHRPWRPRPRPRSQRASHLRQLVCRTGPQ